MAEILVTSFELKAKAEQLKQLNQNFRTAGTELDEIEGRLSSMWEGAAKESFHKAFSNDRIQMGNFYNAVEVYVASLVLIVTKYEQAEAKNIEIGNTRNY